MKRLTIVISSVTTLILLAGIACAQSNPRDTAKLTLNGKQISIEYGRPSLKGRKVSDMLGQLPEGEVWRVGADKSTTFKTDADLVFGDLSVPKGEYSMWVRKEAGDAWKLVFNKQHGQWGTDHNPAQDLGA